MARIPNVFEQVFRSGDAMTGVAHTGTGGGNGAGGAAQSPDGHVYRQTPNLAPADGAIDGGLIPIGVNLSPSHPVGQSPGYRRIISIYVFADGATDIKLILVDTDGFEHIVRSSTTDSLVDDLLSDLMVLPGWQAKVTANAIGAGGAKIVCASELWFNPAPFHTPQV